MKTEADGSRKNVRRRLVVTKVVCKSTGNKDQPSISYEDQKVDPNNPEDDKYDPKVKWYITFKMGFINGSYI